MKKKTGVILLAIIVIAILAWVNMQSILNCVALIQDGITFGKKSSDLTVLRNNCFHEVYCDGDYVYYRCDLVVNNYEDRIKTISIKGILLADYLLGHIKTPFLELIDINYTPCDITMLPEESRVYENVLFRAERGATEDETLKFDRSMPWITLE